MIFISHFSKRFESEGEKEIAQVKWFGFGGQNVYACLGVKYMLSYSTKCFSLSSGGEFYLGNGVVCKLVCGRNGSGVK
jgi:hypothetical protein